MIGFGQRIIDKKNKDISEINISHFDQEIISIIGYSLPKKAKGSKIFYGAKNEKGKEIGFKIRKRSKFFDGDNSIKIVTQNDLIGYFEKWGFQYEGSNVRAVPMLINGIMITMHETTLTFRNNNNSINSLMTDKIGVDNTKLNATNELKRLKELLDLDLITKEEYNKKSDELKKIILQ
tara:strand:- start:58 stop:591 length:534 start_codon:yes stop_codon:yes gene_type:complete